MTNNQPDSKRFTVHLAPKVLECLGRDDMLGLSGRISEVSMRYRALFAEATPTLTEGQWCAICDALNGTWLICEGRDGGADPVRHAFANVADGAAEGLGEKWNVDALALAQVLRDLPYAAQAAVCEVVRRFWHHPKLNDLSTPELLREAGARLAD